jgi:heme o synthase
VHARSATSLLGAYLALTKPRIIVLLLVTALCAMVVAQGGLPPLGVTLWTLVGLGLSCGSANAVNMWYDRDIDQVMTRTQSRPLPTGVLRPADALAFGIVGQVVSALLLAAFVGRLAALLSVLGYVYYVGIYTLWLKRRTPQNIVIGGGAGAFPPLVGWAAVTGHLGWAPWLMFLIVFLWTPPHFWALALYRQDDYRRAKIPMMPVVRGERATKWQSLAYAVLLVAASVALYLTHVVGVVYLVLALALGVGFVAVNLRMLAERLPDVTWAKRSFHFSLAYLTVVFAAMVLDVPRLLGH